MCDPGIDIGGLLQGKGGKGADLVEAECYAVLASSLLVGENRWGRFGFHGVQRSCFAEFLFLCVL